MRSPCIVPGGPYMRIEYKVFESKTGVKRRVQLTPASELSELRSEVCEHREAQL